MAGAVVTIAAIAMGPTPSANSQDSLPAPPLMVSNTFGASIVLDTHVSVAWGWIGDSDPGPATFDIEVRRAPMRAAEPPAWQSWAAQTSVTQHHFYIRTGHILCLRVRQHDASGAVSPWSNPWCLVRPLDDRLLRSRGNVTRRDDWRYPDGRASVLHWRARLFLARVPAHAQFGAVYTDGHEDRLTGPGFHIIGSAYPDTTRGWVGGRLRFDGYRTHVGGRAVFHNDASNMVCRIGGVVVFPRWAGERP